MDYGQDRRKSLVEEVSDAKQRAARTAIDRFGVRLRGRHVDELMRICSICGNHDHRMHRRTVCLESKAYRCVEVQATVRTFAADQPGFNRKSKRFADFRLAAQHVVDPIRP